MSWNVEYTDEFGLWWSNLGEGEQVDVDACVGLLEAKGVGARVVSMPCFELFAAQDEAYRRKVLPAGAVRVGIEAAVRQGWDRWLMGERGAEKKADFVGMDSFGASGPIDALYEHFGITAEAVAAKALALM